MTRSALIVDDAGAFAALAVQALFDAGFDARAATTVDAAFAELVRGVPDVVVIDYGADPTATAWCVGGNNLVTAEQMAGELADVRIYNVTQSASWVARVYKRGRRSYKP